VLFRSVLKAVSDCALNGITLTFAGTDSVKLPEEPDDQACAGFFDASRKMLQVATAIPFTNWLRTLLHEYNHLQQWIDCPETGTKTDEQLGLLWRWIAGQCELEHKTVVHICSVAVGCELDCEKRSVEMIKSLHLPWDTEQYIREANSYLYLYPIIADTGKWCSKQAPYKVRELVSIMPAYFLDATSYFNVPIEVEQLIIEKCMVSD
jgi:hypothetical protein